MLSRTTTRGAKRMLRKFIERQDAYRSLEGVLSATSFRQTTLPGWLAELASRVPQAAVVLDLGCGEGNSVDLFSRTMPSAQWHGVDIESSPEVQQRTREDLNVQTYDGTNLPYDSDTFDIIYSNQVLEHVRHPDLLLPQVMKALKPGGLFIGSVSYLEPHHSRSIFNFTPYGLARVVEDAGLELKEIRPGIDSVSLIFRQMLGGPRFLDFLFRWSPLNLAIGSAGVLFRLPPEMTAFLKIQYSGQFCFLASKPS